MEKNKPQIILNLRKLTFDPHEYIDKKIQLLEDFHRETEIDTFIVGLSGGVDSALVYLLLREFKIRKERKNPDSTQIKVIPFMAPISDCSGVSDQKNALEYAQMLINENQEDSTYLLDLKDVFNAYKMRGSNDWADGQLASLLRTPLAYYIAAIEQTKGNRSLVVGTTNKSEGAYIGFFGKASDGMNDLQLISDIYKSEVFAVAEILGCPEEILARKPKGDVLHDLTDEELMGVSYKHLDAFLIGKEFGLDKEIIIDAIGEVDYNTIKRLHKKNKHKYHYTNSEIYPKSVATHLDVYKRGLPI